MRYDTQKRKRQIKTDLVCPLCGESIEIAVHEQAYYGYSEEEEKIPGDAIRVGSRNFKGKTRYYYRFPGFVPHCSNNMCFLRSANRMFRSPEFAMEAWIDGMSME